MHELASVICKSPMLVSIVIQMKRKSQFSWNGAKSCYFYHVRAFFHCVIENSRNIRLGNHVVSCLRIAGKRLRQKSWGVTEVIMCFLEHYMCLEKRKWGRVKEGLFMAMCRSVDWMDALILAVRRKHITSRSQQAHKQQWLEILHHCTTLSATYINNVSVNQLYQCQT